MKYLQLLFLSLSLTTLASAFVSFQGFRNVPKTISNSNVAEYPPASNRLFSSRFRPLGYYNNIKNNEANDKRSSLESDDENIQISQRAINGGGGMLKQPLLNFNVLWRKFGGQKRFDYNL